MNVDTAVHPVLVLVVFIAQMVSMSMMAMKIAASFVVLAVMAAGVCTAHLANTVMVMAMYVVGVDQRSEVVVASIAPAANTSTNYLIRN
ncbi:MAG: hypothetical protein E6Q51_02665 [Methylophilus methylotrophus]|uniref:Uncharacterized protein n=1 Tax=Methylophilus methylotrophus TaxID=17 RepID=A0A5C7WLX1_METME|nr:MAG: hypothetical protein E6Q51_02665 [Methylophilus methylotrophus]